MKESATPAPAPATTASKIFEEAKNNASEAGVRIAARQLVKLVQEPIAAAIAGNSEDESLRRKAGEFLRSDIGKVLVMATASSLLQALISSGKIEASEQGLVDRITRELRIATLTEGGDMIAELFMGPLRQVLTALTLPSLPEEPMQLPPATPSATEQVSGETRSAAKADLLGN